MVLSLVMNFESLITDSCMTKFQAFFSANAAAQASRKSSPRVNNEAVQKAVSNFLASFCDLNAEC